MSYPGLAIRHVVRNPLRSLLLLGSFAVAAFVFATLYAIPNSINRVLADAARGLRLIVTAPNSYNLPVRYCHVISGLPHVAACSSEIAWSGTYQSPHDVVLAYGVDDNLATVYNDPVDRQPTKIMAKFTHDRRAALVGPVLMRKYGWHIGQHIQLRGLGPGHVTLDLIIVGNTPLVQAPNAILFRRALLDEAIKETYNFDLANTATFFTVRTTGAKWIVPVINEIDSEFHNSDAQTLTMTESDAKANGISAVGDLRPIIYGLCALVMVTMLLVAANAMAMAARERVTEAAVMRALGFSANRVMMLTLIEAGAVAAAGGALGAGAAYAIFRNGITIAAIVANTGYMTVAPEVAILTAALVTLLGVASAALPAVEAGRVAPALAVRQVV